MSAQRAVGAAKQSQAAQPQAPGNGTRKDIQALRAAAVGLVVANHLWPARLPGGYVGVDVFFAISGFLISSHLLRELTSSGRVNLGRFYARRARRLLPAALCVALLSLGAAWLLLPFSRWLAVIQETVASVLYVENWLLAAKSVDYSAHNEAASTVQHYWSLSVEEQFYLLWPLLLLGLYVLARRLKTGRRTLARAGVALVSLAALVFCIWFTAAYKSEAYFVTPARVWEFGFGALLAMGAGTRRARSVAPRLAVRGCAQWLGWAAIAVAALAFNEQTDFPGFAAVLPVIGTLLVIGSGPTGPRWSLNTVLAVRPVQFLGNASYSLYLWHWPLIVLAPAALGRVPLWYDRLGLLVLAVLLAAASKKYLEDPGRTRLFPSARPAKTFLAMGVAMAVVCACGGLLFLGFGAAQAAETAKLQAISGGPCYGAKSLNPSAGCADPYRPAEVANVGPEEAPWFSPPECAPAPDPITAGGVNLLRNCNFAGTATPTADVWLVGDSHAEQWQAAVFEVARQKKWMLHESLLGGCPFVPVRRVAFMDAYTSSSTQQRCLDWSSQVSARITAARPDLVLLSAFGAKETLDDGSGADQQTQYRTAVSALFGQWAAAGPSLYVLRDTPLTLNHSGPDCVALNEATPLNCANPRSAALVPDPIADAATAMKNPKVKVVDLSDQFCDATTCPAVIGGIHVYFDSDHASRSYIRSLTAVFAHRLDAAGDS